MKSVPILAVTACAATFATGCTSTVASLDGPTHRQKLGTPAPVAVTLSPKANPDSFHATVDGQDVTESFAFDDQRGQLTNYVFEPRADRQPHTLTVQAEPALNAKGRPLGKPFEGSLSFFPPAIQLQGNVGMGTSSHVNVPAEGRSSVMIRLPMAVPQTTTMTVTPVPADKAAAGELDLEAMTECVVLNDRDPGAPVEVTVEPGNRVTVFTVRGHQPGITALRVEAPGYVATNIDVIIDNPTPTTTAAVNTP
ncbi:MAG: hypothetical protein AAF333_15320 [Planctomycetota bacterium]